MLPGRSERFGPTIVAAAYTGKTLVAARHEVIHDLVIARRE
jgi:hypothetical protein